MLEKKDIAALILKNGVFLKSEKNRSPKIYNNIGILDSAENIRRRYSPPYKILISFLGKIFMVEYDISDISLKNHHNGIPEWAIPLDYTEIKI
jgi:hypothetical protein